MKRWRTGTKNPHTLYHDDQPAGFILDPALAKLIAERLDCFPAVALPMLKPLALTEDRTPEQLIADGDEYLTLWRCPNHGVVALDSLADGSMHVIAGDPKRVCLMKCERVRGSVIDYYPPELKP